MCGITGLVMVDGAPADEQLLQRMNNCISHRGPDSKGVFIENRLGLAHQRLSIIDLSADGEQPMHYLNRYVIVYNGEVYNYLELKEDLKKEGLTFKSKTDTEVILAAYHLWGKDCVNRFNGMWSFAIFDKEEQTLFCSRDRFGVKPFYYYSSSKYFAFSSEIKQLLQLKDNHQVNQTVLADYLVIGYEEHNEFTFYEGIQKLLSSHCLLYDLKSNKTKIWKYYFLPDNAGDPKHSDQDWIEIYGNELERSVRLRMRSDVKVGTCLSGGADSSSIAAIAAQLYRQNAAQPFNAITARSLDRSNDETDYARLVVERFSLQWHITAPATTDFLSVVDDVIKTQEEPFSSPSIIMQYFVMREAARAGAVVLLDGQGGDETLLGYERYFSAFLRSLPLLQIPEAAKRIVAHSKLNWTQLLAYSFYFNSFALRWNRLKRRSSYLKDDFIHLADRELLKQEAEANSSVAELQRLELTRTGLTHLLKYEDRNSMRFSIETRLPFLDYKLVELALSVPLHLKINGGWTKFILRKAVEKKLPEQIVWRKNKIGFEAPEKLWLNPGEMISQIKESEIIGNILKEKITNDLDIRVLWKLYNISKWEQIYNVKG